MKGLHMKAGNSVTLLVLTLLLVMTAGSALIFWQTWLGYFFLGLALAFAGGLISYTTSFFRARIRQRERQAILQQEQPFLEQLNLHTYKLIDTLESRGRHD